MKHLMYIFAGVVFAIIMFIVGFLIVSFAADYPTFSFGLLMLVASLIVLHRIGYLILGG